MSRTQHRTDILLVSGGYFDFLSPEQSCFGIEDVAHALSHLCRFAGHTSDFYSVAQHSVLVSEIVPIEDAMAGLLHDSSEAFLVDIPRPLKMLLDDYRAIEKRVEGVVLAKFGLASLPPSVKRADLVALATEQRDLMPPHDDIWEVIADVSPLAKRLVPWSSAQAKDAYLARYYELKARAECMNAKKTLLDISKQHLFEVNRTLVEA